MVCAWQLLLRPLCPMRRCPPAPPSPPTAAAGACSQKQRRAHKETSYAGDDLERELAALGLRIKTIEADGNCFFRSVCDQLEVRLGCHARHMHGAPRRATQHTARSPPALPCLRLAVTMPSCCHMPCLRCCEGLAAPALPTPVNPSPPPTPSLDQRPRVQGEGGDHLGLRRRVMEYIEGEEGHYKFFM